MAETPTHSNSDARDEGDDDKASTATSTTSTTRQVAQLEGTEYLDYTNLVAPGCPVDLPDSACAEDPQPDETKN